MVVVRYVIRMPIASWNVSNLFVTPQNLLNSNSTISLHPAILDESRRHIQQKTNNFDKITSCYTATTCNPFPFMEEEDEGFVVVVVVAFYRGRRKFTGKKRRDDFQVKEF